MTMNIRLVRTEGKTFTSGYCFDVRRLYDEAPLRVDARDPIACAAEGALELGGCLYFYAGHACPDFGDLVLVYDPDVVTARDEGSASDFDTGGLYEGHIQFDPPLMRADRVLWAQRRLWSLDAWRAECARFVTMYFGDWNRYATGGRAVVADGDGRLGHPANERRAWTVEVRLRRNHPVLTGVLHIGLDHTRMLEVQQFVREETNPSKQARWQQLLEDGVVRDYARDVLHISVDTQIARAEV